jgi:hypothetical protein
MPSSLSASFWKIEQHACRICFGRILSRKQADGTVISRCSECGTEVDGKPEKLCCCGVKLNGGKNAGLRCKENPNKTPEAPAEIIVGKVEI